MDRIILLLIGENALLLIAYIISGRDIMSPSMVMCLMFLFSTLLTAVNCFSWNVDLGASSILLLLSGILSFILAEGAIRQFYLSRNRNRPRRSPGTAVSWNAQVGLLNALIIVDVLILVGYYLSIRRIVGGSVNSPARVFALYRRLGIRRHAGANIETVGGLIGQSVKIVLSSGYCAAFLLIQQHFSAAGNWREKARLVLLILLSCMPSLMIAGRTSILQLISASLVFYHVLWHQYRGWNRNLSFKVLRIGLLLLIAGVPLFYYSLQFMGRSTNRTVFEYVSAYVGGSIVLFDQYIKYPVQCRGFGEESLVGMRKILAFLGMGSASTSYNLEVRPVGMGVGNVYSFFRRPYHDFGLFGMYVFTIAVSILFSGIYYGRIKGKPLSLKTARWTLAYGYLFFWIVISSIDQYSSSYVSAGTVMIIMVILVMFQFLIRIKVIVHHE